MFRFLLLGCEFYFYGFNCLLKLDFQSILDDTSQCGNAYILIVALEF